MERKKASDFDPQLLNLFDRYVHGGINRREFLEGAAKFAIGGLTATALWDMLRPNYALGQQVPKDDKRIKAEYTMYPSPKGNSSNGMMRGLLARPATGDKFPVCRGDSRKPRAQSLYRRCRATLGCRRLHGIWTGCDLAAWRLSERRQVRCRSR